MDMLMTQNQSIRISGIMSQLCPAKLYYPHMVEQVFNEDGGTPPQNENGEWLNYTVTPETWFADAMEALLTVAEKLDYQNILLTT